MGRGVCRRLRDCFDAGWGFVALGVLLIISAFLLGVVYFSIRAITTSLEHVDIVPTYATALLICCAGILVMFLHKRRDPMITMPTLVLSLVCLVLTFTSLILLGTKVIRTMDNFHFCRYNASKLQCHCYLDNADQPHDVPGSEYIYSGTPSCDVIETTLVAFAHTQCGLYALAFVLCNVSATVITFTVYHDRKVAHLLEEEQEIDESAQQENWPEDSFDHYPHLASHAGTLPGLPDPNPQVSCVSLDLGTPAPYGDRNLSQNPIYQEIQAPEPANNTQTSTELSPPTSDLVQGGTTNSNVTENEYQDGDAGAVPNAPPGGHRSSIREGSIDADQAHTQDTLWDGFCLRPPEDQSNNNGFFVPRDRTRPVRSNQSFSGTRTAVDPAPRQRPRGPPRQRSRHRPTGRGEGGGRGRGPTGQHPCVTVFSGPYPLYRSSHIIGVGVSPFPMEPPPPYRASPPPPYTENEDAGVREYSASRDAGESVYYNIPNGDSQGRNNRI